MSGAVWLKALVVWMGILLVAIANGAIREQALIPAFGSSDGSMMSGITLSICIFVVALAAVPWYGALHKHQWLLVGLLWLGLTVLFEFAFGRLVQQKTWAELLQAYTFREGNLWPAVLVVTIFAPFLAAKMRGVA